MKRFAVALIFILNISIIIGLQLEHIREWKQLDFDFPTARDRTNAVRKGQFVQENAIPIDVDVDYQGKKLTVLVCRMEFCLTLRYRQSQWTDQESL